MRKSSRDLILQEAFKLFATKSYEQVTYNDFEKNTGLTRGTILYHFASKELLFREVVNKYVFNDHSIAKYLQHHRNISLKDFLDLYLNTVTNFKAIFSSHGIENMNRALLNIENQAIHYYPSIMENAIKWQESEIAEWMTVLQNAIASGEIKGNVNISILSRFFQNIYYGTSYSGIMLSNGFDTETLREEFVFIYNAIKN
jgi:AcrR family transcriptional regulator